VWPNDKLFTFWCKTRSVVSLFYSPGGSTSVGRVVRSVITSCHIMYLQCPLVFPYI